MEKIVESLLKLPPDQLRLVLEKHKSLEETQRRAEEIKREIQSTLLKAMTSERKTDLSESKTKQGSPQKSIVQIMINSLKEAKRPMTKRELAQAVIASGYPTKSKNLEAQIGVLLYGEKSKLFRRVGRGQFILAKQ